MELQIALIQFFFLADYTMDVLTGVRAPIGDDNPFLLCAEHIRAISAFGKDRTSALAIDLGWIPHWERGPKGEVELTIFFDLQALWLELYGIEWEFHTVQAHTPLAKEGQRTLAKEDQRIFDFLAKARGWARAHMNVP